MTCPHCQSTAVRRRKQRCIERLNDRPDLRRALGTRGGLRARVITAGTIHEGDLLEVVASTSATSPQSPQSRRTPRRPRSPATTGVDSGD